MINFSAVGNDLYTGRRSVDFIGKRRIWYLLSGLFVVLALLGLGVRHLNLGLEFRGGSEFRVANVTVSGDYETPATHAVQSVDPNVQVSVTKLGTGSPATIRVQTEKLTDEQSENAREALAKAFGTSADRVSATFVGPSWGQSVSQKALKALVIFLLLVSLAMALYFRTWKMAVAGLVALLHDLIITVGIYALTGLEVSPASMIGFLTILGYSLYDTVVVFDKVRENTAEAFGSGRTTFDRAANLAVNQTLVRSINTTVVALLPIAAILFIGFTELGPGTLLDLAMALFVGIAVGAYSSIFIATPLYVTMRRGEPAVVELAKRAARYEARVAKAAAAQPVAAGVAASSGAAQGEGHVGEEGAAQAAADAVDAGPAEHGETLTGRKVHRYAQASGPRNQPKRTPKSRR
ncbi:Protein-export membrane protein secF [Nostocoides japonicum T1-X7]|uniref:Protein-export membrane protein SecF n=1 Tax=Nostocoides japonicum T1-X7 TaxID=1194083 RepID=A0A077M4E7_9MICO|nr:protein translocase subunit SecF [Tetrasphaera japonica]CCH79972.1 Protein-export membrane protein secF [Tetrasphaera japonica T1-X7]